MIGKIIDGLKNFPKVEENLRFTSDYDFAGFANLFLICCKNSDQYFKDIANSYSNCLNENFTYAFKVLLNLDQDQEKSVFFLCQHFEEEKMNVQFCFLTTQILRTFFSPSKRASLYIEEVSEKFKFSGYDLSKFSLFLNTLDIPKYLLSFAKKIIKMNSDSFKSIIKGINTSFDDKSMEEIMNSTIYEKAFLLPKEYQITAHTDYAGNIYFNSDFGDISYLLEAKKSLDELDEGDFFFLVSYVHEYAHKVKIMATQKDNKLDPLVKSPRDCMLYQDESKTIQLYPEAGCFIEVEAFGSVIDSKSSIKSPFDFNSGKKNAVKLFSLIESGVRVTTNVLKGMSIPIAMNKECHFGNHPYKIKHD